MEGRRAGGGLALIFSVATLAGCATQTPSPDKTAAQVPEVSARTHRYSLPTRPAPSWSQASLDALSSERQPDPEKILSGEWEKSLDSGNAANTADLAVYALNYLGVPYRRGGASPEDGFDCSGLVSYVSRAVLGLHLPRRAEEMSRVGEPVKLSELQPGDLVFYNTLRRKFSHVGIYLGEGRFVHSPASGGVVRVERMDIAYWKKRFNGARRLASPEPASR
ncbi:C40 family peptidase [uncultured Pigmentiphaga sp.]|jgi:Cell wall-associated hydrolases (invasion-associated proteins)|uniref:C40 family peptidase n=1 Tax=uncultured Pigmentiphaga sp. TaxID=340361 RepID=UPI002632343C|nr:C40 family peptidase [uncultured Pigmentiphaga sp.]